MIISTRRNTKKFDILTENENVALLVHDFQTHTDRPNDDYELVGSRPRYSITLNGTVRVANGEVAERYRNIHLQHNAGYEQFILGKGVLRGTLRRQAASYARRVQGPSSRRSRARARAVGGARWPHAGWRAVSRAATSLLPPPCRSQTLPSSRCTSAARACATSTIA